MTFLIKYDAACRAIAEAKSIDEIRAIRDRADAVRAAARVARNKEPEINFAEIRFRAERRLGELMAAQRDTVGLNTGAKGVGTAVRVDEKPTLAESGIDKNLADRSRKLAAVPDGEFERLIGGWRDLVSQAGERVTTKLLKAGERERDNATIRSGGVALPAGKYAAIYADPPWTFRVWSGEGKDRAAENHYPTMTQEQIASLPVENLADNDCALFLWAVWPQLPEALDIIDAWGFEYKTCAFLWTKRTKDDERFATGMGYWTRANSEPCLLATRGSPTRLHADVHQVVEWPRMEHSRKPDDVPKRIERLVGGPYIELFARQNRPGWSAWGNQI